MPHAPTVPLRPSLVEVAETIHHATTDQPVARVVHVGAPDQVPTDLVVGFWDIPEHAGHPVEPLVGFRAPASWDAIGLISTGRLRRLDGGDPTPRPVLSTVLTDRSGNVVSLLDSPPNPLQILHESPVGLVADVLARALGLPTPPPEQSIHSFVELTWLDRLAAGLLGRPGSGHSWRWLADRHPLRGDGPLPAPDDLAARVWAFGAHHTWASVLARHEETMLPAATLGPPGGTTATAGRWFDEGSLSRWALRNLPPADALVPDLLSVLPPEAGELLLAALTHEHGT